MRSVYLPFHIPSIGEEEVAEVVDTLRSGWLTTGSKTARFEDDFCRYTGARYAVAVSSGTAALHLALAAMGLRAGEEVIVPTLTFAASAEVVCYLGGIPRFVDVNPRTLTIDVEAVEAVLRAGREGRTIRAILPVHYGGYPCDMDPLMDLSKRYRVAVIDDAAHALPTFYKGRMVGTLADVTAFSFYATKTITTGEGGMLTTANQDWASAMRMMSLHGITQDAWKRYAKGGSWYYEIARLGYKYNLSDIASSLGIQQLRKCDDFLRRREAVARRYTDAFSGCPGIDLPESTRTSCGTPHGAMRHAWHLYPILLDLERLSIDRARFIEELKGCNIGSSVHFIPLHLHPFYQNHFGYRPGAFPVAEDFYAKCVSLPIYPRMTDEETVEVAEAVTELVDRFKR
ncbi:MAG: DegT/DnrJ/EryC1/StrS aminotransferase family protein [bacterium]